MKRHSLKGLMCTVISTHPELASRTQGWTSGTVRILGSSSNPDVVRAWHIGLDTNYVYTTWWLVPHFDMYGDPT